MASLCIFSIALRLATADLAVSFGAGASGYFLLFGALFGDRDAYFSYASWFPDSMPNSRICYLFFYAD